MLRGEFIRGDGLVIPNNITTYGIEFLFKSALTATGYNLHMGLANCNPDPMLLVENLNEPTIGINGYTRKPITQDSVGWPSSGQLNGEQFYETKEFTFEAGGGSFDKPIIRLALINSLLADTGRLVVALSGVLPAELTIDELTPLEDRTFKYRIYGR